ncbi:MAG: Unknown protein [uncultured Sulfurovum sp.]|uniref:Uncharacterized protein n=1 Tax=uncultured Sulfurovum sp. TaxID=269237 RepID=A0A6S6T0M4_9BACT|nr:MAG: Unknown protein [uncultured Sulfurovum sp.]
MQITPERSRHIFGNPSRPKVIKEKQFDGFDKELKQIAKTHWKDVTEEDLWYYLHDLAYVDLQPELFNYLFPICLNFWYNSLMRNDSADRGDTEFHYSLYRGKILETMVTDKQKKEIYDYFYDGFLERIEKERGFEYIGTNTPAYSWMYRFNSLGYIAPIIEKIWLSWWEINTPGKAVSAIMYASGLIYVKGENPIFEQLTPRKGGGGPYLTESDADIYDTGWLQENINFLNQMLSVKYIQEKVQLAANQLSNEPEAVMAQKVANDALIQSDIIQIRIEDLINNLSRPNREDTWDD